MDDIWTILGIEKTKDIIAIKRAYSAKAKTINKEDNPDDFRKLHDAYKAALGYAKLRDADTITADKEDGHNESEEQQEQTEQEEKIQFDFDCINGMLESDVFDKRAERIIDDIVTFRTDNNLNDMAVIRRLPAGVYVRCVNQFTAMYIILARVTDDVNVWDSFVTEPIIETVIEDPEYRAYLKTVVPNNSAHMDKINSICDAAEARYQERRAKEKAHNEELTIQSKNRDKARKKGVLLIVTGLVLSCILAPFLILISDSSVITVIAGWVCIIAGLTVINQGFKRIVKADKES